MSAAVATLDDKEASMGLVRESIETITLQVKEDLRLALEGGRGLALAFVGPAVR